MIRPLYEDDKFSKRCRYYTTGRYKKRIKISELDYFLEILKNLFYDRVQYKWKVKKAIKYILEKNLSVIDVTEFLHDFHAAYLTNMEINLKSFEKFCQNLKDNPKLAKNAAQLRGYMKFKKDADIHDFISDVQRLNRHIDTKDSYLIEMIYKNFQIPYAKSTFTRFYYDNKNSEN